MTGRPLRFLRSRRAASYLLVYLTVFLFIDTLLPFGGPQSEAVKEWALEHPALDRFVAPLGLHDPYTSPWFLVPALWLAVSTCACALERTVGALRAYRSRGMLTAADVRRLDAEPTVLFAFTPSEGHEPLAHAESVLRALRMRVRRGPAALTADSRALGLAGSPLFHVALGLLFVFAMLGWLTRWEGGFYALRDRPVTEVASSYLPGWTKGLFFGNGHTGYTFTVTEVIPDLSVDGVPVGTAVRLVVRDGERIVKEDLVRTNRPMRFGRTMVHHLKGRIGNALVFSIESSDTPEPVQTEVAFKTNAQSPSGVESWSAVLGMPGGGESSLLIEPARDRKVMVRVGAYGTEPEKSVALGRGESTALPGGGVFTVDELTRYAEVTVVHDWSVPVLYLMFVLSSLGAAITVALPYRRVYAKLVDAAGDGTAVLACVVLAQKSDPAFRLRLIEAFEVHGFERLD